jgi:hypothetical protein
VELLKTDGLDPKQQALVGLVKDQIAPLEGVDVTVEVQAAGFKGFTQRNSYVMELTRVLEQTLATAVGDEAKAAVRSGYFRALVA